MKKNFKSFFLLLIFFLSIPQNVHAQATFQDLEEVFEQFVGSAIGLVGIICIVMLIVGGIGYLTAGVDKEGAARANHTITYGVIGLIITISAWIILSLLGTFLGLPNIGTFSICLPGYNGPGCT